MMDQGLMRDARHGDLRDLITRSPERGAVVSVSPEDTLMTAHSRMRLYDVSQLPVLQSQNIVGIIDESDLLLAVHADAAAFGQSVGQSMSSALETIPVSSTIAALLPIFERGMVAIVMDGERFAGLLTKIDLLNHLRNSLR
jgi:cystathionine beta-synthase